jgi:hypothetical protein
MLLYAVEHFFAGAWTLVWHFGVGFGVIILCGVGAYLAPTPKLKLLCIGVAALVGALLLGEGIGVHMEKTHVVAQEKQTDTFVDKTVKSTTTPSARGKPDPWNSKDN